MHEQMVKIPQLDIQGVLVISPAKKNKQKEIGALKACFCIIVIFEKSIHIL